MEWLKGFDLALWWNKLIAVGVAITVAALTAHERGLILIGLGMIAWGFGESRNHLTSLQWTPRTVDRPAGLITGHPRFPCPFGLVLDACGLAMIAFGLYRLLTA